MANNIFSGERTSFFKLFSKNEYKISVPIIQRDYAQGRSTQKSVREKFLKALYAYLNEAIPNRDLDFVYGTLDTNSDKLFIPLDGQQRLTTLFLLHWYLCQISTNSEIKTKFVNALMKNGQSQFTYETRTSSSDFCNMLLKIDIGVDVSKQNSVLSEIITNLPSFYLSWKYDPTIISMLNMLDSIHKYFIGKGEFFELLLDEEKPIITFLFLNLEDFKLTDELYIKMNSRGKPLTEFENFKAKFEQYIKTINSERRFFISFGEHQKEVSLSKYFSFNVDTKWAKTLWGYRHLVVGDKPKYETYDDELMNFIRAIFTYQYASSATSIDSNFETLLRSSSPKNDPDKFTFYTFDELNALSEEAVLLLIDTLDFMCINSGKITTYMNSDYLFYYDEEKVFKNALLNKFSTNHERLCFYAFIGFIIYNKLNTEGLDHWMRFIHNISHPENNPIDEPKEMFDAIKSINKLLPLSSNIMKEIANGKSVDSFRQDQVFEEHIKATLILKSESWRNAIESIEKHNYFNGQIGFILNFSGICDYYNLHHNCDWTDEQDVVYFDKFNDYSSKAAVVFANSYDNRVNNKEFLFERATLTKGIYFTDASQNRKNILTTNVVKNNIKRDHSWKRNLRIDNQGNTRMRVNFVKDLFDDIRFDINNLEFSLQEICKDKTNDWRDYLIESPNLMSVCNQGFIRFENSNNIRLYRELKSANKHVEMYTYHLWDKYIRHRELPTINGKSISGREYWEVKSIDEHACIIYGSFIYKKVSYQIEIYYWNYSKYVYSIDVVKTKGLKDIDNYDVDFVDMLLENGFEWFSDSERFVAQFETEKEVCFFLDTVDKLLFKLQ